MEKKIDEYILGFDSRFKYFTDHNKWNDERKMNFLYRLDIEQPFSVDSLVWPSIFNDEYFGKPPYVGFYPNLWQNLKSLKKHLNSIKDIQEDSLVNIAVILHLNFCSEQEKKAWENLLVDSKSKKNQWPRKRKMPCTIPSIRSTNWQLLGYDVGDMWGISGLANCGFLPKIEDVQLLRNKWGTYLNKYHLFENIDITLSFKKFSNGREKGHAPFFIYSIWLI